jgi:hypothetical protein
MEAILKEHERLEKKANLGKAVDDVQKIIDQLEAAKAQILAGILQNDPAPHIGLQLTTLNRPQQCFTDNSEATEPRQAVIRQGQRRSQGHTLRTREICKGYREEVQRWTVTIQRARPRCHDHSDTSH